MDSQRSFFIIACLFALFVIWQIRGPGASSQLQSQIKPTMSTRLDRPNKDNEPEKKIKVKTDVLELTIDARGGDVVQALLLEYAKELKSKKPFQLLETTPTFVYQAQSGLTGRDGPDSPANGSRPLYKTTFNEDEIVLSKNQNQLIVPMIYKDAIGNIFTKIFTLKRGKYSVNVDYRIQNISDKTLELAVFGQLKQSIDLPLWHNAEKKFSLHAFRGAAYSSLDEKYKKYKFHTIAKDKNLDVNTTGGWIAMLQQYFAAAWIPDNGKINNFYTAFYPSNSNGGIVAIGYKSLPILVKPGQTDLLHSTLWIGPEIQDEMATVAPYLDLTVDYGWLWFISQPLFRLLKFIHSFSGNWGLSIIAITFIVRGIMYPLTKAQYTAMARMRSLQPKIQEIRERLGDDKQRISQEMISLYKSEKVNPLGGCFPILIQMPIFLALYYMLIGSVELRHAPFLPFLWIHDLSAQDPYYIFPILMGITMYFIQKISPTGVTDPMQKKIATFMPLIFTFFFLWFPSGLVLYYIVSNLVTILQQQIIYRELEKRGLHKGESKRF